MFYIGESFNSIRWAIYAFDTDLVNHLYYPVATIATTIEHPLLIGFRLSSAFPLNLRHLRESWTSLWTFLCPILGIFVSAIWLLFYGVWLFADEIMRLGLFIHIRKFNHTGVVLTKDWLSNIGNGVMLCNQSALAVMLKLQIVNICENQNSMD